MDLPLLVVDDDPSVRELLRAIVEDLGYACLDASDGVEALEVLSVEEVSVVFTDMRMPRMDGRELLGRIRQDHPHLPVVVATGLRSIESAVEVMRTGAVDFVLKPFHAAQIEMVLRRLFREREREEENRRLKEVLRRSSPDPRLVGADESMQELFGLVARVAPTDATVLIQGESGTGKELVARIVHQQSLRDPDTFLAVNCAALSENLLESEIFGHEAGSFTGAQGRKTGLIEVARGGTLFLDEIGETSTNFQAKLLRVLQEREFLRLGGTQPVKADVRVLAATNKDLKAEAAQGRFREDLFYRLNVFPIVLPPLRERRRDIPLLVERLVAELTDEEERPDVTDEALALLQGYDWPGNVRELRNVVERALILAGGDPVGPAHLPGEITERRRRSSGLDRLLRLPLSEAREAFEERYLRALLRRFRGNVSRASEHAGVSRGTLHGRLKKLSIDPDTFRQK